MSRTAKKPTSTIIASSYTASVTKQYVSVIGRIKINDILSCCYSLRLMG